MENLRRVNGIVLNEHNHIMRRCATCQRWKPRRDYPLVGLNHAHDCRDCTAKQRVRDERVVMAER